MLLGLVELCRLQTKRAVPVMIVSYEELLILGHDLFKLLVSSGLSVVSKNVGQEPVTLFGLLVELDRCLGYLFFGLHFTFANKKRYKFVSELFTDKSLIYS
jgi:hypothetical protein